MTAPWQVPIWTFIVEAPGGRGKPMLAAARGETAKAAMATVDAGVAKATRAVPGTFRILQTALQRKGSDPVPVVDLATAFEHARGADSDDLQAVTLAAAS